MKELTYICSDCGDDYIFSIKDQVFYKERGFVTPKRCRACRELKKQRIEKERNETPPIRHKKYN